MKNDPLNLGDAYTRKRARARREYTVLLCWLLGTNIQYRVCVYHSVALGRLETGWRIEILHFHISVFHLNFSENYLHPKATANKARASPADLEMPPTD